MESARDGAGRRARTGRPRGVALVGAVAALLAAGAVACDDEPAPPVEIEGSGALEGLLFFDENRDGLFDPSAGDEAVSGVRVEVRNRGTDEAFSGSQETTRDDGRFRVEGLPAGTHDLFIDTTTVSAGVFFCQNPLDVTVELAVTRFREVAARNGCVISIAEAEAMALGEFVTTAGIVTSYPGQIDGSSFTHIEDSSGGIRIFDSSLRGEGIEIGDRIEVSGTLDAFNDDLQLSGVTLNSVQKDVADPTPEPVTTGEIADAGPDNRATIQGSLLRVEGAEMLVGFGQDGLDGQNGLIDDGSGAAQIRVDDGVWEEAALDEFMQPGTCYDVTGVMGNFRGTGQIFPRSPDDVREVPCS